MVNGATPTPERTNHMAFTKPYQDLISYLFFHVDMSPIREIADLRGQTVGVLKGSNVEEYLRLNVPDVKIVALADYEKIIFAALGGRYKVFIAEEPLVTYHLTLAEGADQYRRSANIVLDSSLCMAVRKEDTALLALINKGFDAITKEERNQIDVGWFGVGLGDKENAREKYLWLFLALGISAALASMVGLARVWNRELSDIRTVRTKFINMWLVFAAFAAMPLLLFSAVRAHEYGWSHLYTLHFVAVAIIVCAAIFRNHIHYYIRTLLVLLLLYCMGLGGLLTYGIVGATQLPLMALVVVTVILFGMKAGIVSIFLSLATLGSVTLAIQAGLLNYTYEVATYSTSLLAWANVFMLFAFYVIGLGFGAGGVYRHMEEALRAQRESESLFRNLVETTSDWIWESNERGDFVYSSPQVEAILGYTPEEVLGKKFYAFMPEEEKRQLTNTFRTLASAGQTMKAIENANLHKDGHRVILESSGVPVLDASGKLVGYRGVARDITDRKRSEEERERLVFAIEQAAESIVITDPAGIIQYANAAFETVTGCNRDESIGMNIRFLKTDAHNDAYYEKIKKSVLAGNPWTGRTQNTRKDGTPYTAEVVVSPVRNAQGALINIVVIQRDVTNEIVLEEQLRQSQKMEAVGQLAGGVAHDFNNLLQAILGYGDLALDEVGKNDPLYNSLEEIIKASQRASTLVRQLLAFSRRQVLEMKDVNLNDVAGNLMKMIRRVIGEHITLDIQDAPGLGTVHADAGQLEQILMNLCVNARDAMPEGGTITINMQNVTLDEDFCKDNNWDRPGRYVCMNIADTGCGMDEKTLRKIFEPFFTTKEIGRGTGLGLATVYGIVKQHEGFILVSSEPGMGTTFSVYLPQVERTATPIAAAEKQPAPGGTETILIAEDDEIVCRLSQTVLERAGYTVLTAADGAEALDVFGKHRDAIALVLLDVIMPKLSGLAVFERVRSMRPDLCVLFSSGYSIDAVHADVHFNERTQMIQKPYHPDDLLRKVRQILDGNIA